MKVANIKTSLRGFFHHWITVTRPLHNLGKTERSVLSELLYYRYLLSQEVTNNILIDKLLFEYETRNKICASLNIPKNRLPMALTTLRKAGVVIGKRLNTHYIPELNVGDSKFTMAYKFHIEGNEEIKDKDQGIKKVQKNSKKT